MLIESKKRPVLFFQGLGCAHIIIHNIHNIVTCIFQIDTHVDTHTRHHGENHSMVKNLHFVDYARFSTLPNQIDYYFTSTALNHCP